jgi:hypothetical protein
VTNLISRIRGRDGKNMKINRMEKAGNSIESNV